MVLMQHDRDLPVAHAEHDLDVQGYKCAQALFWIGDCTCGLDHALLGDVHGVAHDVEEHLVFALEVMVEASLAELERGGYVVHRRRVVAALLEEARGGTENIL